MQIIDPLRGMQSAPTAGKSAELRQDHIVTASIKQKLSSSEAVVEINGQEYRASFEKEVPQEERIAVQVAGRSGDVLQLRAVSGGSEGKVDAGGRPDEMAERILREAGIKATPEIKEAVRVLLAERMPVAKETLQAVQQILQKGEGTVQQKLNVISIMAQKKITITPKSYESVFRALHGPSFDSILNELAKEAPELVPQSRKLSKTAKVEPVPNKSMFQQLDILSKAIKSEQPINREALQKLIEKIKRNPDMEKLPIETRQRVEQVVRQVEKVVQETPRTLLAIPAEKLAKAVNLYQIDTAKREIAQEASRITTSGRMHETFTVLDTARRAPDEGRGNDTAVSTLSRQLDVVNKILQISKSVDKEELRRVVEQIKQTADTVKLSPETRQQIEQVVQKIKKVIEQTPQKEISVDNINKMVDRQQVERIAQQVAKELTREVRRAREPVSVSNSTTTDFPRLTSSVQQTASVVSSLAKQIDVLEKVLASEQPISREQMQKFVESMRRNMELANMPSDVQRKVQRMLDRLDRIIHEMPRTQEIIPASKLEQLDRLEVKQLAESVSRLAGAAQVKEMPKETSAISSFSSGKPSPAEETLKKLAELVIDLRTSGKVTRSQIEQLQDHIVRITEELKVSPKLTKDMQDFAARLARDLRMSISYEAVGREAEAKAMVEKSMDTLVRLFKLPVSEVAAQGMNEEMNTAVEEMPNFLRPVSETFGRLGSLVSLARQELQVVLEAAPFVSADFFAVPRTKEQIVGDLTRTLREAVNREALPREEVRQMEQLLKQLEAAVVEGTSDKQVVMDAVQQLEQMLTGAGERLAALTAVQTMNFERVTHYIPDYLREVAQEFKQVKKEILNNVDRMSQFLQQKIPQAASYVERIIEPTIEMVNRLVNKGEFALFADMEFEHDVLRISSELQKVKGLLDKGKQDEALQLFQRVRSDLEKLNWQPSYMKVERFFSKTTVDGEMRNPLQLYSQQWREESLTGRSVQEMMRSMGLNYERDALEWLGRREGTGAFSSPHMGSGDFRGQQDSMPHNMKFMLMDGMEHASPRAREMMEQALSNLTGQQLLSKQEPGAPLQSMYVQIPLPWEEGLQSVQMQIQSRTNGEQMDWENCNLFFFLNTPKFGETGISVTVVEREMTIRVQNDTPNVEAAFAPYIPQMERELQQMGYRVNGVTFTPVAKQPEKKEILPTVDIHVARNKAARYTAQEGLDFSV